VLKVVQKLKKPILYLEQGLRLEDLYRQDPLFGEMKPGRKEFFQIRYGSKQ